MTKYRINGLDCANCANEIECALKKEKGLENARLSFATGAIYLDAKHVDKAQDIISRIEPGVTLSSPEKKATPGDVEAQGSKALTRMVAAAVLLAIGSVFNETLHATPHAIVEYGVLISAFLLVGTPVLLSALRSILRGQVFNEMFLMSIATIGAIVIHQLPEAVGVMLFYSVGEYLQDRAVDKSRRSISALMDLRPDFARLVVGPERREVSPEEIKVGDLIEVLPGERIPLDGSLVEGSSFVNTASLTGESVPRKVEPGDSVLGGFVND
jgi:Cd2+/Zn2+-exporting ATPase